MMLIPDKGDKQHTQSDQYSIGDGCLLFCEERKKGGDDEQAIVDERRHQGRLVFVAKVTIGFTQRPYNRQNSQATKDHPFPLKMSNIQSTVIKQRHNHKQYRPSNIHHNVGGPMAHRQFDRDIEKCVAYDCHHDPGDTRDRKIVLTRIGQETSGDHSRHRQVTAQVEPVWPFGELGGPKGAKNNEKGPAGNGKAIVYSLDRK